MRKIPFSPPDVGELEIQEVCEALQSGWITTGPRVKQLEKNLAEFCHTHKVVCLSSATAAEELNFRMLEIEPGDEVIVPAYTYTASASAAIHAGATVVFVDCQEDSFEMDYQQMENAITERTKAIVAVDIGGLPCNYDKIFQTVENKKHLFRPNGKIQEVLGRVAVFADSAHALGASYHGKMTGSIADFTSFSFHAVKNFTTAEGGAATWKTIPGIDDEGLYRQYQLYSLHGQSKDAFAKSTMGSWEYDVVGPWYKCNMTDIAAAIGLKQLERYGGMLEKRKKIIDIYDAECEKAGILHLNHYGEEFTSAYHLYLTRIPGIGETERNEIIIKMAERGISCNVHFKPLPMMTAYKKYGWDIKDFPNAYNYYKNLITLPLYTKLNEEDVQYIIQNYTEICKEYMKRC